MIYDVPNLYYYIDIQCSTLPSCSTTDSTNDGLSYHKVLVKGHDKT